MDDKFSYPKKVYREELDYWVLQQDEFLKGYRQESAITSFFFQLHFLIGVKEKFKVKVLRDNLIAAVIEEMLKQLQFRRFWISSDGQQIKRWQIKNHGCKVVQKWRILLGISELLEKERFITKSKAQRIKKLVSPYQSIEYTLQQYSYFFFQQESSGIDKAQLWEHLIGINFQQFWIHYIKDNPAICECRELEFLFSHFQAAIAKVCKPEQILQIQKLFKINTVDIFTEIGNMINFFSNKKKAEQVEKQLKNIIYWLKNELSESKRWGARQVFVESYGSYRNRFCLLDSDVDLTVFLCDSEGKYDCDRKFVEHQMHAINRKMKNIQGKLHANNIYGVINEKIKVPLVTMSFNEDQPLRSLDIVLNNQHGINNSKLFSIYASNEKILNFGLSLKHWAKSRGLISKKKLSSYGVLIMMIYFLMKTGRLSFITQQQIKNCLCDSNLKGKFDTLRIFQEFLLFYSQNSEFFLYKETICLVKGCSAHSEISAKNFLINIHDPYDNSNPGRLKLDGSSHFFQEIELAKKMLAEVKANDKEEAIKSVCQIIGVKFQVIKQQMIK